MTNKYRFLGVNGNNLYVLEELSKESWQISGIENGYAGLKEYVRRFCGCSLPFPCDKNGMHSRIFRHVNASYHNMSKKEAKLFFENFTAQLFEADSKSSIEDYVRTHSGNADFINDPVIALATRRINELILDNPLVVRLPKDSAIFREVKLCSRATSNLLSYNKLIQYLRGHSQKSDACLTQTDIVAFSDKVYCLELKVCTGAPGGTRQLRIAAKFIDSNWKEQYSMVRVAYYPTRGTIKVSQYEFDATLNALQAIYMNELQIAPF